MKVGMYMCFFTAKGFYATPFVISHQQMALHYMFVRRKITKLQHPLTDHHETQKVYVCKQVIAKLQHRLINHHKNWHVYALFHGEKIYAILFVANRHWMVMQHMFVSM